jgi:hypothetical protein
MFFKLQEDAHTGEGEMQYVQNGFDDLIWFDLDTKDLAVFEWS